MNSDKHFHPPTKLSKEPHLSLWYMAENSPTSVYIQTSEDEQNPIWLKLGDVLEMIYRKELDQDEGFIQAVLQDLRYGEYDLLIRHMKNNAL